MEEQEAETQRRSLLSEWIQLLPAPQPPPSSGWRNRGGWHRKPLGTGIPGAVGPRGVGREPVRVAGVKVTGAAAAGQDWCGCLVRTLGRRASLEPPGGVCWAGACLYPGMPGAWSEPSLSPGCLWRSPAPYVLLLALDGSALLLLLSGSQPFPGRPSCPAGSLRAGTPRPRVVSVPVPH